MDIVASLQAEMSEVSAKLEALDQIKNDRATLVAQSARLKKAIAMLSGEPVVRKPMSPEAKERIRAGLEKARAAKAATAAGVAGNPQPVTTQVQPAPSGPETVTSAKKPAVAEKGEGRGK